MKRISSFVTLVSLAGALLACATVNPSGVSSVSLPPDVRITSPDPGLPPEIKAFSGMWGGRWQYQGNPYFSGVDAILVVEKIEKTLMEPAAGTRAETPNVQQVAAQAVVLYAWGESRNTFKGWKRITCDFLEDERGIFLNLSGLRDRNYAKFRVNESRMDGITDGIETLVITLDRIP